LIREKHQHFWKRWQHEYLSELQYRSKWKTSYSNITLGTLVIIYEDNLPSHKWSMGRVLEIHPGTDKRVRAVTLKTQNGTTSRAINRVAPLPLEISNNIECTGYI
jgi:hypothetical protein